MHHTCTNIQQPGKRRAVIAVGPRWRIEEVWTRFEGETAFFVYDNDEADLVSDDGTGLPPVHGPFTAERRAREYIAGCEAMQ